VPSELDTNRDVCAMRNRRNAECFSLHCVNIMLFAALSFEEMRLCQMHVSNSMSTRKDRKQAVV